MSGNEETSFRERVLIGGDRFLSAVAANALFGLVAGAILAQGFWFFGAIAGAMYGSLAGAFLGALAAIRLWSRRLIIVACGAQFIGALVVGFGMAWAEPGSGPPDHAVEGMLGGGVLGAVVAEALHLTASRSRRPLDGTWCSRCGYNLRGNVTGRCPECGCATKLGKGESRDGTVT